MQMAVLTLETHVKKKIPLKEKRDGVSTLTACISLRTLQAELGRETLFAPYKLNLCAKRFVRVVFLPISHRIEHWHVCFFLNLVEAKMGDIVTPFQARCQKTLYGSHNH